MDREEAKRRMCVKFMDYVDTSDLLEAILNNDEVKLADYRDMAQRVKSFNEGIISNVDAADDQSFDQMCKTWQRPRFVLR